MTEFDTASLAIAKATLTATQLTAWATVAAVVVSAIAAIVAITALFLLVGQVKAAVKANSIGQLNALLSLEEHLSRRRDRLGEINHKLQTVITSPQYHANPQIADPIVKQFDEAGENYLNALDRLCFCIIQGKFSEDELRADYRDVVKAAIKDFPNRFTAGSEFRHIIDVHNRWAKT